MITDTCNGMLNAIFHNINLKCELNVIIHSYMIML